MSPLSFADLADLTQARIDIEGLALRLAIRGERGTPRDVETERPPIIAAIVMRDGDAAVRALSKHRGITREFIDRGGSRIAEVSGRT